MQCDSERSNVVSDLAQCPPPNKVLTLAVPSGIGDISWLYSKLHCAPPGFVFDLEVADGWPHRSVEFCQMLPRVREAKYADFNYTDIMSFQRMHGLDTFEKVAACGFGRIFLAPNEHLEAGRRLEGWLPDLPTDFHYQLRTSAAQCDAGFDIFQEVKNKFPNTVRIGVSAASYRGSEAWSTWRAERWNRFLDLVQKAAGGEACFVLMGGFWDDLTYALSKRDDAFELVGKTDIGTAYMLHNYLDGYVGFSSGLGVMRTLLGLPTMMLWPAHQVELSTSWAPPEMLREHSYVAAQWIEPFEVAEMAEPWLRKYVLKEVA